jgi:hypothetical protein
VFLIAAAAASVLALFSAPRGLAGAGALDEQQVLASHKRRDPREVEKAHILSTLGLEESDLTQLLAAKAGKK